MATGEDGERGVVPPAGERVHLPGPSFQPALLALGSTIAIVGVVISPAMLVIGGLIFVLVLVRWIRDARAEMAELPLSHE